METNARTEYVKVSTLCSNTNQQTGNIIVPD
jgi:hypothetical protein